MDILAKSDVASTHLIDLCARGVESVDPERGIHDFLASYGRWSDALDLQITDPPERPVDDTGEKGETPVAQDRFAIEVCTVRPDPAGDPR